MSPRVRSVLQAMSELSEDERDELFDQLSQGRLAPADPVRAALERAPLDDESITAAEELAIAEGRVAAQSGEVLTMHLRTGARLRPCEPTTNQVPRRRGNGPGRGRTPTLGVRQ